MVREVAPNLSYHYWGLGIRGLELEEEADPSVIVRGSEFNHDKEIEMEDDEGHMGTATTRISSYRTKATASPSFTDKCRYREGWEDIWLLLLGSDDGEGNIRKQTHTGTTNVWDYTFKVNVDAPQDPYFCTIYNGFAKTTNDAYKYEDCLLSEFELSGSNEEAPTYTASFQSNFPKFHQTNPTRTFPNTTIFPKSAEVKIYIAPQGTYTLETIAQYEYPCYLDWSLSVNNNIEGVPCSGDAFGESTKVLGNREGTFNITLPWTSATKNLEYKFMGGNINTATTTVSPNNDVKTVWIVMTSAQIASYAGVNYQTIIKIPRVVMTAVNSPQSGSDAKQLELEGNIEESGTDSFIETTITTALSELHIDDTPTTSSP